MNTLFNIGLTWIIFWLSFGVLVLIGWIMNIGHVIHSPIALTGLFIVRVAGIFIPPLGGFMGWFF